MIWELYMNQSAEVIIGEEISEAAEIGRGGKAGRVAFNNLIQHICRIHAHGST